MNEAEQDDAIRRRFQRAMPDDLPTAVAGRMQSRLAAFRDQLDTTSARPQNRISQWIGGFTVRQRIAALGGIGTAAALVCLLLWGAVTKPVSAMEKMAESIRQAKSLRVTMAMECQVSQEPGRPPITATMTQTLYWLAPKSYRMEAKGGAHTSGMDGTQILPDGKPGIHLDPTTKTFCRMPARPGAAPPFLIFDKLAAFSGQADRNLGEKEIRGAKARGFEIDGKKIDPDAYAGPVEIWLDAGSSLPVFVRYQMKSSAGPVLNLKMESFQWNIDLDTKLFLAEPPPGYVEQKRSPAEYPGPEKVLQGIKLALQTYAELCGGRYPQITRSFAEPVRDEMYHAAGLSYPGTLQERIKHGKRYRKVFEASQGFAVFNRVMLSNPDVAYHGRTVGSKDKDKVLLRWRLDDGRYQVLYGDLRAETVTAERLRALEGE